MNPIRKQVWAYPSDQIHAQLYKEVPYVIRHCILSKIHMPVYEKVEVEVRYRVRGQLGKDFGNVDLLADSEVRYNRIFLNR